MVLAPCTTWLFVAITPLALTTNPVPGALFGDRLVERVNADEAGPHGDDRRLDPGEDGGHV